MMGANIDYAIVISSRYLRLKEEMPYKEAMIEALNQAFPTVVTSGTISPPPACPSAFCPRRIRSRPSASASAAAHCCRWCWSCACCRRSCCWETHWWRNFVYNWPASRDAAAAWGHACQRTRSRIYQWLRRCEIHGRVNGTVSASIDIGDVQMEELPAHVAPPAQLHSEEGSDEET